jgi:hypothetical protein
LGISTTRFDSVEPGGEEDAACLVAKLAAHFAGALPDLCA